MVGIMDLLYFPWQPQSTRAISSVFMLKG